MLVDQRSPVVIASDAPDLIYSQALRGERWRWWRPLLGLLIAVAALTGAILSGLTLLGLVALHQFVAGVEVPPELDPLEDAFYTAPAGFAYNNLFLAAGILVALAASAASMDSPRLVTSVTGRMRWRLVIPGALICAVLLLALGVLPDLTGVVKSGGLAVAPAPDWMWLVVIMLVTTPLQAAGEEYFFRGWMSQWIGSWFRWRWAAVLVPLLVTSTLFSLAHGTQNAWLFADRFVLGVVASVLVWRTGGLELAIALHVVNNLIAFGWAIATDTMTATLSITEVEPLAGFWGMGSIVLLGAALLGFARWRRPVRTISGS